MATYQRRLQLLRAHLKAAELQAELSYAKRLKVGAVIVRDGRTIVEGRNGTPSGMDNNCEEPTGEVLTSSIPQTVMRTKPEVCHAEANAISFAAKEGIATNGCIMVTTHSPCFECAKLIKQAGITAVYYHEEYRLTDSLDFLKKAGVKVERIDYGAKDRTEGRETTETRGGKTITSVPTHRGKIQDVSEIKKKLRNSGY